MPLPQVPVLLYDGTCGFCARNVQFVLAAERGRRDLLFATLEGAVGQEVREAFPFLAGVDSMVLYVPASPGKPGSASQVLVRSRAALAVAAYLGGRWRILGAAARLVPRAVADAAYTFVARHRHRISGAAACLVPTPEQRARFLDER